MEKDLVKRINLELKRLDPRLSPEDESFKAAAVLLAGLEIGLNISKLSKALGYDRSLVCKFAYNLRKSRVWRGRKTYANWNDEESGGVAFWMDVCVAQGLMEKI